MARQTIIKTTPSWNQKHFARKDSHIRFLARRFPNKPRDDPGLPNPPLPPGASRLAFPIGSTGSHTHKRTDPLLQWLVAAELPTNTSDQSTPISLAIGENNETLVAGYPRDSDGGNGITRVFTYDETTDTLVQKGNDIIKGEDKGYNSQSSGGFSVAIAENGNYVLIGAPSSNVQTSQGTWNDAGYTWTLPYDGNDWDEQAELEMWYTPDTAVPLTSETNSRFGTSLSLSGFDVNTNSWYSSIGAPGSNAFWVVELNADMTVKTYIGNDTDYSNVFGGSLNIGHSTAISDNVGDGNTNILYVFAGAPGDSNLDNSFVRVVKGTDTGNGATWEVKQTIELNPGRIGFSLAATSDGSILITGDPASNKVYVYASTDGWSQSAIQLGQTLEGATGTEFGYSVAINRNASATNPEGTTIVIGQPGYDDPLRPNIGRVIVLEYINGAWQQVLNAVTGQNENERFGQTVAMRTSDAFLAASSREFGKVALYSVQNVN